MVTLFPSTLFENPKHLLKIINVIYYTHLYVLQSKLRLPEYLLKINHEKNTRLNHDLNEPWHIRDTD